MTRPLAVTITRTVISFFVSVPVLSDAITVAEPSVSTAARCRTMAFRLAIRCTPIESTAVTTVGRPRERPQRPTTPRMSTSNRAPTPRTSSTMTMVTIMMTAIATTTRPSSLPVRSSSCWSGRPRRASFEKSRDAPHLGPHARCGDDSLRVPVGRGGAAEDHVVPIAERHFLGNQGGILRGRQALAGECSLRCPKRWTRLTGHPRE